MQQGMVTFLRLLEDGAVRSTLMKVRRMLPISMHFNHKAPVRLEPLVLSHWVLARC